MFKKILGATLALALFVAPGAHAQTTDLSSMLERMQTIMSEMEKLQAEFRTLTSQVNASAGSGAVLGAATSVASTDDVFTMPLAVGETNDDIKRIQALLTTDAEIYDHPHVTGFYGPKTEEAIRNLQTRFNLEPVGVIGPATRALLEGYFRAYPNGNYPDGVLSTKPPAVLGASTSGGSSATLAVLKDQLAALTGGTAGNPAESIEAEFIDGETWVDIVYKNGAKKQVVADSEDEDEVVAYVVKKN